MRLFYIKDWGGRTMADVRRIRFTKPVHLVMKGGLTLEVSPGAQPGQFAFVLHAPEPGAQPARRGGGRPPSPATLKLRERLQADKEKGAVADTAAYIEFYRKAGAKATPQSAQQTVRREMRAVLGATRRPRSGARASSGGRGRPAAKETLVLRERMEADIAKGVEHDTAYYTRWLVDQVRGLGLKPARMLVYRERRRLATQ